MQDDFITPAVGHTLNAARATLRTLSDAVQQEALRSAHSAEPMTAGDLLSHGRLLHALETAEEALFGVLNIASSHLRSAGAEDAIASSRP